MPNKPVFSRKHHTVWKLLSWVMIGTLLLSACGSAQTPKVYHVGVLMGLGFVTPIADGFKAGMTELGYVEGQNITYDIQVTDFDMEAYRSVLQKFIADKVDLIFVSPTEATMEAKAATQGTGIPVLFSFAFTEGMGIIDSVREPGGNITGVRFPGVDISVKRFEILHQLLPNATRVWLPYQRGYPIVPPQVDAVRPLAEAAGITITEFPADNAAELKTELDARAASGDVGMDAIFFVAEPLAVTPDSFEVIAKFAYENNVPLCGAYNTAGDMTSVYGVNVDFVESGRLAAPLADKIFKGTSAGTIPAVSPDNFIQINYTTAQRFGLTVPEGLLKQADEVIR
jgi:putative ABC transport system substrate-binding protein